MTELAVAVDPIQRCLCKEGCLLQCSYQYTERGRKSHPFSAQSFRMACVTDGSIYVKCFLLIFGQFFPPAYPPNHTSLCSQRSPNIHEHLFRVQRPYPQASFYILFWETNSFSANACFYRIFVWWLSILYTCSEFSFIVFYWYVLSIEYQPTEGGKAGYYCDLKMSSKPNVHVYTCGSVNLLPNALEHLQTFIPILHMKDKHLSHFFLLLMQWGLRWIWVCSDSHVK